MSGRLVKKILKEQEEEQQKKSAQSEELHESSDDSLDSAPPSRNPFHLLDEDDDNQGDELENTDETSTIEADEQEPAFVKSATLPSSSRKSKKKKKKGDELENTDETSTIEADEQEPAFVKSATLPSSSRKSKKKKKKAKEEPKSLKNKSEKSVDAFLESLTIDTVSSSYQDASANDKGKNTGISNNTVKQHSSSILSVDSKFLNPENELRRIFGSDVVRSFETSSNTGSSRQVRGGRRGTHNPRRTFLVSPSGHWPRWDGSLSMELVETRDAQHFFKYVHTSSYTQAQRAFESAKAINDLNGIASILVYYPYHIESLMTIAEVLKFSGEHQQAADAISKCLYALECAWHPMFTPLSGNCQLKYSHEANRPLFSVLFTHMQNMDRRGCHRSALEVCKFLLSLDSDDPMGAMFCVDYYALRAEEYSWLEQFSEEYKSDNSLWLFPNFSYSLAICRLYLERESVTKNRPEEKEKATSTDLMKQALLLHPLVLKKLVEKAPLKDPAWTKILKHKFFGSAQAGGPSLEHLIDIYVERSFIVWRLPDLQALLRDAAHLVLETLDRDGRDAMDWACVRQSAFPSEKNEYSHLLVSDFSGSVPTMPPEDLRDLMVDPRMVHAMGNGEQGNPEVAARAPLEVVNRNPFVVFLESMLPWAEYGGGFDNLPDDHNRNGE